MEYHALVVICFEFIIFALSITAKDDLRVGSNVLWFASNLLFLHYQSQHIADNMCLLRVVICFEFIIFALSITAAQASINEGVQLWFASNLLFLHYQSQQRKKSH